MKKIKILLILFTLGTAVLYAQNKPVVQSITATGTSNSIITVSWELPKQTKDIHIHALIIYKNTRPITAWSQIQNLKPAAQIPGNSVSWNDNVKDSREYYYAVVSITKPGSQITEEKYYDEELDPLPSLSDGTVLQLILPGVNATVNGAKTKIKQKNKVIPQQKNTEPALKTYENDRLRDQPLPYIDVLGDKENHLPEISSKSEEKAKALVPAYKKQMSELLDPYIFEEDLISPPGGDEYLLFEVLKTSFINQNYEKAITDLKRFLAINRTPSVTARANFYLGEAFYFTGDYSTALIQFLNLEEQFPALCRKWSDSTLDLYQIPDNSY